jgi:hypothetical protein
MVDGVNVTFDEVYEALVKFKMTQERLGVSYDYYPFLKTWLKNEEWLGERGPPKFTGMDETFLNEAVSLLRYLDMEINYPKGGKEVPEETLREHAHYTAVRDKLRAKYKERKDYEAQQTSDCR